MPYMYNRVTRFRENMHYKGILKGYHDSKETTTLIQPPEFSTMIADSAKMRCLD